jgi:uncharacterized YccA/Bax inhibitor family protein
VEAEVQSSNPVLTRLNEAATRERGAGAGSGAPPGYGQPAGYGGYQPPAGYPSPVVSGRTMTVDDVVVRTVGLLALTGVTGAISWYLLKGSPLVPLAMIGSSLAALVLGLVISFARITNPFLIGAYAVIEGVLLGVVSQVFESRYPGIVVQAVVGTFGVFAGMAALYKFRVLRATPRFRRGVIGALIGVVVLSLVNFAAALFGFNLGLIDYGVDGKVSWLPIIFSLVCIVVGALTFVLDFDMVEQGARMGLPERYAWYCAFGLLVGLIFLYWQILRLLGYLRR